MKSTILLLCLMSFAPFAIQAQKYKHKSEAELVQMTPAQRVDEWVDEYTHHRFDLLDEQKELLMRYVTSDGLKALPRMIEITNEYDPTRSHEGKGRRGERFDGCWQMLSFIDNDTVRLRVSEESRQAIDALESAIRRMRAAGYGQPEQDGWAKDGRVTVAEINLKELKGSNSKDDDIRNTFHLEYEIDLSDEEFIEFTRFLTDKYPEYPSWSKGELVKDKSRLGLGGYPIQVVKLTKPERYYEAYTEFKKTK